MKEHDQRFKTLLREFLPDFLHLFFPERAKLFDLEHIEWLDKELLDMPPRGDPVRADLVASLRHRAAAGETLALIHIEPEWRRDVSDMPRRMYEYFRGLRRRYEERPVLPIAVYLRVGHGGIGIETYTETFADLEVLRFQYLYVGLPALQAEQYVAGDNWLGVALAALMRVPRPRKVWLRAEALRRVLRECRENDYRRFLLQECVEAYLQLSKAEEQQFQQLLGTEPYKEIKPMMLTTFEKGVAKGLQEGQLKATRLFLEQKFGPLSDVVLARLAAWPAKRIDELIRAVYAAPSLDALGLGEDAKQSEKRRTRRSNR